MALEWDWIIYGVGSFCLLVVASWCVGEGGEILGKKYDASIIGGLVIAWLNTAPETIFFVTALYSDNPRFAVGAVSGSSIVVCTVALGACLWIGANARNSGTFCLQPAVKQQCAILGGSLVIPILITGVGFSFFCGLLGVAYYAGFLLYSLRKKTDKGADLEEADSDDEDEHEHTVTRGIAYLVVGGVLIFTFSHPFITSVVHVAAVLNISPILLAFFLAPVASEMPEILESISLSRKGRSQSINIAFSNLVGGTITKTTLLCGIFSFSGVSREFLWESPNYTICLWLLIICAGAAAGIGVLTQYQHKWHGALLFGLFVITGIIQYTSNVQATDVDLPDTPTL